MFENRSSVRKGGHPFVRRIDILSGNRSSVRTEDKYNLFWTRSSVYLRNYSVDIYRTTFWRSNELFFSRIFCGTSFE